MSVLVFLHKSKYTEWHNMAIYSTEVEKRNLIKKSPGARGQMKTTTATTTKLVLKAPYILYEKGCAIP